MTKKINPQDWEAVSAYIDNELSSEEREQIELRLESEPELRALMDDMQRTRTLVKKLEPVRAPRDFTLTPAMAGIPQRRTWAAPAFQYASAFVMILFVLVIVGDFSGVLRPQLSAETARILEVAAPTSIADLELEAEALPLVEAEAVQEMGEALEAPSEGQDFVKTAPTPTALAASDSSEPMPAEPDAESGLASPEEDETGAGYPVEIDPTQSNTFLLRILEIGLAITALLLALGALLFRRR